MDENEEFEFRLRAEKERGTPKEEPPQTFGQRVTGAIKGMVGGVLHGDPLGAGQAAGTALEGINKAFAAGGKALEEHAAPDVPKSVVNVASKTLEYGGPALVGGGIGVKAAPVLERGAEGLMQSAVKPILSKLKSGEAATAIRTMLEEGVNVSKGGMRKLRMKIDSLNEEIKDAIAKSPATVNKKTVALYLKDLVDRVKNQVNPQSDLNTIKKAFTDFLEHPSLATKEEIPVQQAQAIKQGTYREIGGKAYGEMKGTEIEAQKTLARGLKEEVAKAVPGIAGLNAEESKLITTLNVAERRILMDANKNPGGLTWLAKNPAAAAAFMADRSPLFKSLAARMIYKGAKPITAGAGAAVGVGQQALSEYAK